MHITASTRHFLFLFLLIPAITFSQKKDVVIRLQQAESVLLDSFDTHVTFQKKSFKILVLLENMEGVYCYASFDDSLYRLSFNDAVPHFSELPNMVMAEEKFNKEKELLIDEGGWAYWFYNPGENWHRFNKKIIQLGDNRVVGTKTIKQIYFVATHKEEKLKEIDQPLYLFFVAVSQADSAGKPTEELLRKKVKIDWVDED